MWGVICPIKEDKGNASRHNVAQVGCKPAVMREWVREKERGRQSDAAQVWMTWSLDRTEHVTQLQALLKQRRVELIIDSSSSESTSRLEQPGTYSAVSTNIHTFLILQAICWSYFNTNIKTGINTSSTGNWRRMRRNNDSFKEQFTHILSFCHHLLTFLCGRQNKILLRTFHYIQVWTKAVLNPKYFHCE